MLVNPDVSVIVPVFNAAAYLEQCIKSLLEQTLAHIEVIAVNDGSTDESGIILNRLAISDKRLKVVHTKNRGVSAARNVGLELACGTYIAFCDADDWMEPTMLEEMQQALVSSKSDWTICNVMLIQEEGSTKLRLNLMDELKDIGDNRSEFIHDLMQFRYDYANWNKLFKASIIRKQQLRFNEQMHIWEDLLFNLQYLQYVDKVAIIAKPFYNYRILSVSLYSGDKSNKVPHFNKLFNYYTAFAYRFAGEDELNAFKTEIADIAYNQLLYQVEVQVKKEHHFFLHMIKSFRKELKGFDPAIFNYTHSEVKGLQCIKRILLQHHHFGIFAFIIAIKSLFLKPYLLIRQLLKN